MGRKVILEHPAFQPLVNAAKAIESAQDMRDVPQKAVELLHNARASVRAATDVLLENDPLKQKLGVICLFLLQATTYKADKIDGKIKEVVEVTDEYLFAWALRELHNLPASFK